MEIVSAFLPSIILTVGLVWFAILYQRQSPPKKTLNELVKISIGVVEVTGDLVKRVTELEKKEEQETKND